MKYILALSLFCAPLTRGQITITLPDVEMSNITVRAYVRIADTSAVKRHGFVVWERGIYDVDGEYVLMKKRLHDFDPETIAIDKMRRAIRKLNALRNNDSSPEIGTLLLELIKQLDYLERKRK